MQVTVPAMEECPPHVTRGPEHWAAGMYQPVITGGGCESTKRKKFNLENQACVLNVVCPDSCWL